MGPAQGAKVRARGRKGEGEREGGLIDSSYARVELSLATSPIQERPPPPPDPDSL